MLSGLPGPLKAAITFLLMVVNTILCCIPLLSITLAKLLLPIHIWQRWTTRWLVVIAEQWIRNNNAAIALCHHIEWDIQGLETLNYEGWYLVTCNHQSWVDILVLQKVLLGRIPFLKFFLKQELIWVPIMGVAWWALDFPFMKRYSKAYLEKHPEMKGKDLDTTRRACEKFKRIPVSVMNFLEGTRLTPEKHQQQGSPYRHLLKPKSGGIAFVLSAMGGQLRSLVDVTIAYDHKQHGFWDFMLGRVHRVRVRIVERPIPEDILQGDYENDPVFREHFQQWVNRLWQEKDALLTELGAA